MVWGDRLYKGSVDYFNIFYNKLLHDIEVLASDSILEMRMVF